MKFNGQYNFKTNTSNYNEIGFLYTKLTATDELFDFTTPITSWRRMKPTNPVNPNAAQSFFCHEMPDNCGNYATLADCLIRKLGDQYEPQTGDDAGATPPAEQITAVFSIGENTNIVENFIIFQLGGTIGKGGFYGIQGGNKIGFLATVMISNASLFKGLTIPVSLTTASVGYNIVATKWNAEAFNERFDIFYKAPVPRGTNDPIVNAPQDYAYYQQSRVGGNFGINSYGGWIGMNDPTLTECMATASASNWYYAGGGNFSNSTSEQHVFISEFLSNDPATGYVVFEGTLAQLVDFTTLLNQSVSYWGLSGGISMKVIANPFGCSYTGENNLPLDPNPQAIPPVASAQYYGRYSEIFVNFQKGGKTQELKLPIRFPTRATKIQYSNSGFYDSTISPTSGQQPVDFKWNSELFRGIIEIDKDFIWVKILYAPFREWKEEEKAYAIPYGNERAAPIPNNLEWTLETRRLNFPQVSSQAYGEKVAGVVPHVDWFERCRVFKIQKEPLQIIEDVTYQRGQNQAISSNTWTHEITNSYVLLDHRTEVKPILFFQSNLNILPTDGVVPNGANIKAWGGNPLIYPQIGLGVDDRDRTIGTPHTFQPYLKPQEHWSELDWLFFLLCESPANRFLDFSDVTPGESYRNLYFNFPGKFSGYGRIPKFESLSYNRLIDGIDYTEAVLLGDDYYSYIDMIVEYNRFIGSAINSDGTLSKWIRLEPNSFPIFYIKP